MYGSQILSGKSLGDGSMPVNLSDQCMSGWNPLKLDQIK